jgi:hypothetical protein
MHSQRSALDITTSCPIPAAVVLRPARNHSARKRLWLGHPSGAYRSVRGVTARAGCLRLQVAALAVGCSMVLTGKLTAEQLTNFIMCVGLSAGMALREIGAVSQFCSRVRDCTWLRDLRTCQYLEGWSPNAADPSCLSWRVGVVSSFPHVKVSTCAAAEWAARVPLTILGRDVSGHGCAPAGTWSS